MTSPSSNPMRLQVLDRIQTVLAAIVAGSNYWYTPYGVGKKFVHWMEPNGYPYYMVFAGSGGPVESESGNRFQETFHVTVKGYVQSNTDTVTVMEKALRDIRKAIMADAAGPVAGSLGALGALAFIKESAKTDDGYLSAEGFGFFDQDIEITIIGDWATL